MRTAEGVTERERRGEDGLGERKRGREGAAALKNDAAAAVGGCRLSRETQRKREWGGGGGREGWVAWAVVSDQSPVLGTPK